MAELPQLVARPAYDRREVRPGIVHLGLGAFHRAHQAVYTDDRLAAGEGDWGIIGLSLRSSDVRDALAPQDGLYTVLERSAEGDRSRVVGAVLETVTVPETPERALAALVDPRTRIISLTVTEKAYCLDAATGSLDETHPGIVADLQKDRFPATLPGLLVEALRRRHETGAGRCTLLVCDNLPSNGETVARVLARYAMLYDPQRGESIIGDTAFPCTMVDRIVPATTEADRAAVQRLGYRDAWPVVAEPFSQWVIEDRFAAGRPRWEDAGVTMVTDVRPFELMKLRALNGAHSSLAYLGVVAGLDTVADAMAEPLLAGFLRDLWDKDLLPVIPAVPGMDLSAYTAQLETRFRNPAMRHRLQQISMDGSQKLPQRLLHPALDRLRAGETPACIALVVAAWMRFLLQHDEPGNAYEISDPLAERLTALAAGSGRNAEALAGALFGVQEIFDPALAGHSVFRKQVVRHLKVLLSGGVRSALTDLNPS
nr:mannitol dehydrogenase family protein [uncultured Rhodopila sp.]